MRRRAFLVALGAVGLAGCAAPDSALYMVTSNRDGRADGFPVEGDDRIVRVVP